MKANFLINSESQRLAILHLFLLGISTREGFLGYLRGATASMYGRRRGILDLRIVEARELKSTKWMEKMDPYVKVICVHACDIVYFLMSW